VLVARFYPDLAAWLEDRCTARLDRLRPRPGRDRTSSPVPGCVSSCRWPRGKLIASGSYDGVVALGVVVRGGHPRIFDYVAGECARGIMDVQLATGIPIGFGVLTTNTLAQAEERADPGARRQGLRGGGRGREQSSRSNHRPGRPRVGFR